MMKKRTLLIIGIPLAFTLFTVCGVLTVAVAGGAFLLDVFRGSVEDMETWREVDIPIEGYDGQVTFQLKPAHPFLAEYYYRIELSDQDGSQTYDLPMNAGGQVNENVFVISYQDKEYLEVRDTLFDLENSSLVEVTDVDIEGSVVGAVDDMQFNTVRVYGERDFVGRVTLGEDSYILSQDFDDYSVWDVDWGEWMALPDDINWGEWIDLPEIDSRIRFGGEETSTSFMNGYIEIENVDGDTKVFKVSSVFDDILDVVLISYDTKHYISVGDMAQDNFNIENLIYIPNRGASASIVDDQKENIELGSAFLMDVIGNGQITDLGTVEFTSSGEAVFEDVRQ